MDATRESALLSRTPAPRAAAPAATTLGPVSAAFEAESGSSAPPR